MDRRLSRSMPLLVFPVYYSPITYRAISPRWPERCSRRPRRYYVGGVRTHLIGADSYPNPSRSPSRLILCGSSGSYQKMTLSSSTAELSRSGVYSSREDLRPKRTGRRATSCEDVFRGAASTTWDSRLSESGVSLNDSRTDLGSCVGLEDVDGVSQCSFGSSSAFHEITCDSEMDRPDSDCVSVPGSGYGQDRARDASSHDSYSRLRRRDRSGGGEGGSREKSRHNSGSREKFLAELTASSGRSSPQEDREFYHSTPTKRGSPILSIFTADEDDLHFPSHLPKESFQDQSSVDSLLCPLSPPSHSSPPASPQSKGRKKKTRQTSAESISSSEDTVKEALRRRRQQFFSSLQDCSRLEEQSAGESVQSWLTTGHLLTPLTLNTDLDTSDSHQLQQQPPLSPSSPQGCRISVRDRVRAIEQGPDTPDKMGQPDKISNSQTQTQGSGQQASDSSGEHGRRGATGSPHTAPPPLSLKEGGGAERASSRQLLLSPGSETASLLHPPTGPPYLAADVFNELSSTNAARADLAVGAGGLHSQPCPDDQNSTALSSSQFSDNQRETSSPPGERGRKVGREPGTGYSVCEEDNSSACLRISNSGTVTVPAGQLPGANYGAVSDDRSANTGADPAAANTAHSLLSANSVAAVSTSGGHCNEASVNGFQERTTHCITQDDRSTISAQPGNDDEEKSVDEGEKNGDAVDRGSERLVPGWSDTDSTVIDTLKGDRVDKAGGGYLSEREQDKPLYHARPIQIVSPDEQVSEHARDTVTPSPSTANGDNPTPPSYHCPSSSLAQEIDPPSTEKLPDHDDFEVQSVLAGVNTEQLSALSNEEQEVAHTDTGMDRRHHASHWGLSPDDSAALGDVSQRHTRYVYRKSTTVEETVTTRHTIRHHAGSPTSVLRETQEAKEEDLTWLGSRDNRNYEMTDRTVSKITVTEVDDDEEKSMTKSTTTWPLFQTSPESSWEKTEHTHTAERQEREQPDNSYHILDSLRERLSILSSEDASFNSNISASQTSRPPFGYKDHAEASLPRTNQAEADSMSDSSGVVRGTGSVLITLDRSGSSKTPRSDAPVSGMTDNSGIDWETDGLLGPGSLTTESGRDASLYRARAVEILPTGEYSEGRWDTVSSSQPVNSSSWGLTGSSSEINDSDDRCTTISVTDGSHPRLYSDSDNESRLGKSTAIHSFQEFLCGLQDQFTSDQPTLHRSVDMMVEDFPSNLLRSSGVQETILEADDERDSTDEELLSPTINSFKSSLHFCVPQSDPTQVLSLSSVPHMREQSLGVDGTNITVSEDSTHTVSPAHLLQSLSDELSGLNDVSGELHTYRRSHSREEHDLSTTRQSDRSSPTPSAISEKSLYSTSASAEVQKLSEATTTQKVAQSPSAHRLTNRRLTSTYKGPKKSQWVQEKVLLFQKLLNDFESQRKTSEQKLLEEMVAMDAGHNRGDGSAVEKQSEAYDDLYRQFTREHLENRQNHVCPVNDDHLPAIRFRRFLKKKHNSKLKGHKTVRVRHQMERLTETPQVKDGDVKQPAGDVILTPTGQPPYHIHQQAHRFLSPSKLRARFASDVFTDDADVNRSMSSDSAYSSLSASSRYVSDLDSTFRSVNSSRADVSSIANDASMDEEKMRLTSEVFDHMDLCEGDIDEARLNRLQVCHTKAGTL